MEASKSLAESIRESWDESQTWAEQWNTTEAAGHFAPLPPGIYAAIATAGALGESGRGTPRYRVTFTLEGEHNGRRLTHDFYLSAKALPLAKRDLAVLGITHPGQLSQPLRPVLVRLRVALRRDDDGSEFNRVVSFEALPALHAMTTPQAAPVTAHECLPPDEAAPPAALFDPAFGPEGMRHE